MGPANLQFFDDSFLVFRCHIRSQDHRSIYIFTHLWFSSNSISGNVINYVYCTHKQLSEFRRRHRSVALINNYALYQETHQTQKRSKRYTLKTPFVLHDSHPRNATIVVTPSMYSIFNLINVRLSA